MKGKLRDDRRTVDVDDVVLAELQRAGGKVLVNDGDDHAWGEVVHDGAGFVVRLAIPLDRDACPDVTIKVRYAPARGASA